MIKRITILLTFLAYSLSLVHSLVPHHHREDVTEHTEHHHSNEHHENDEDSAGTDLAYFFGQAEHHPAAQFTLHSNNSNKQDNSNSAFDCLALYFYSTISSDGEPPGLVVIDQENCSDSYFKISLLRAPPALT
jgi:hypothetical protein